MPQPKRWIFLIILIFQTAILTGCQIHTARIPPGIAAPTYIPEITPSPSVAIYQALRNPTPQPQNQVLAYDYISLLPELPKNYDLYVLGLQKGELEVVDLSLGLITQLNKQIGLQNLIIEAPMVYQSQANEFINSATDHLPSALCEWQDFFNGLRDYNTTRLSNEKIKVYLVGADQTFREIYLHLVQIPKLPEGRIVEEYIPLQSAFLQYSTQEMHGLIAQLIEQTASRAILSSEIQKIEKSLACLEIAATQENDSAGVACQEELMKSNALALASHPKISPLVVITSLDRAQKAPQSEIDRNTFYPTWIQSLSNENVRMYVTASWGLSGQVRTSEGLLPVLNNAHTMYFPSGERMQDYIDRYPKNDIFFVDLQLEDNFDLQLGYPYRDLPAGQLLDSLILFRFVTPVISTCTNPESFK